MTDKTSENYGKGEHELEADAVILESAADFAARLKAHFTSPGYTPPLLPAVAMQVQQLSTRADVDIPALVAVMEKDPMFAARVLKIAQSAAFASAGSISSLRDAVVRIGLRNLTDIAWEVAMNMRIFRSQAYAQPMESVRRHSTACAHLCRMLSSVTGISSEYAFLCGLLHDIGMASSLVVLGEQQGPAPLDPMLLGMILRRCHQEASMVIGTLWKLPGDVQLVLGHHHEVMVQGFVHPLAAVVAVAEQLARELGFGVPLGGSDCDNTEELTLARARDALKLDKAGLDRVREEAKKLAANFDRGGTGGDVIAPQKPASAANRATGTHAAVRTTGTMTAFAGKPPVKR
ncbi:MAG TPA: HDOD domain-containing protein [Polyangia bacterium]|nr:HDOD domain-containing protein [Polyangia bacterium]